MKSWIQKDRRTVLKDRWLALYADDCQLPDGSILSPYYVMDEREWTHVVAMDSDGRVLVVRQYRYGARVVCSEWPGGVVDAEEAPLDAAKRELREETGFEATDWTLVGVMYANPARQNNRVHCYLARGLRDSGARALDASEEIEFGFKAPAEVREMIRGGEFSQGLHMASFFLTMEYLNAPVA